MSYLALIIFIFYIISILYKIDKPIWKYILKKKVFKTVAKHFNLKFEKKRELFSNYKISGVVHGYIIDLKYNTVDIGDHIVINLKYNTKKYGSFNIVDNSFSSLYTLEEENNDNEKEVLYQGHKYSLAYTSDHGITALLNEKLRNHYDNLFDDSIYFSVSDDYVEISCDYSNIKSSEHFIEIINKAVVIANEITRPGSLKKLLIENIKKETEDEAVTNNFKQLVKNYSKDKDVKSLILQLKKSKVISRKLLAAEYLGKKGMLFLIDLLQNEKDLKIDDVVKIINVLSNHKIKNDYSILIKVNEAYRNDQVLMSVVKAISKLKLSTFDEFLLNNIDHEDDDIRDEAFDALAECGTVKSVEKLHMLLKKTFNPFKRNKIQNTIAQIQSRLGDVEKGWVSVSEEKDLDGALSKEDVGKKGMLSREAK